MPTHRIRLLGLFLYCALATVWGRVAYLQLALGPWHRAIRADGEVRTRFIPAPRGTIRTADGTELARDRCDADVSMHYRYLERPLDDAWLLIQARNRLSRRERRDAGRVEQEVARLRDEINSSWRAVTKVTGTPEQELERRAAVIRRRVERIVESVNRRRREHWEQARRRETNGPEDGWVRTGPAADTEGTPRSISTDALRWFVDWLSEARVRPTAELTAVTVVEQDRYYTLIEDVSPEVALHLTSEPERFPGARLEQRIRRVYPQHELACSVIGYIEPEPMDGSEQPHSPLNSGYGVAGTEGFYDEHLRGVPGLVREQFAGSFGVPRIHGGRPPQPGQDITLTLDLRLQQHAEESLERAMIEVPAPHQSISRATSGAVLVLDIRTGAVLCAASAPRFDLNAAARPASDESRALAARSDAPLFSRIVQMTLPPGSIFKPVTAVAALKAGVDPRDGFLCRGYFREPDKFRCLVFRNLGVGHETVTMNDAVVRSCNVYFFHLSNRIGWQEIVRWGDRFGLGTRTGIDLDGEEPGRLPDPAARRQPRRFGASEGERLGVAIGQGSIVATPVQVGVMMAAIANGGWRVVPHVRRDAFQPPFPIAGIDPESDRCLAEVRRALEQVVADPRGTGHEHVHLPEIEIAGKTGTAQSGSSQGDHAWFAGYVPAKNPRYALVVTLEHAGSGAHAAGPVVRGLVRHMLECGYLFPTVATDPRSEIRNPKQTQSPDDRNSRRVDSRATGEPPSF